MLLLHLAAALALVAAAWWAPGRAILGGRSDRSWSEHGILTLAVGWSATNLVAFTAAMLSGAPLGRAGVLAAAGAITIVAVLARRWAGPFSAPPLETLATPERDVGLALLLAFVLLVGLGRFSAADLHLTCENYPSGLLLGLPLGEPPRPRLLDTNVEQNLGTSLTIGPTVALLGIGGYRVQYALNLVLIAAGTAILVRACGGSRRTSLAGGALASMLPLIAAIREIDPNLNTLAFSAIAFALIRPGARPAALAAGLAFGVAFATRYVLLPGGIALAWLLTEHPVGRRRALAGAALGFLGFCVPIVAHNVATYGTPFMHPSLAHFPEPAPHALLGVRFALPAAFNWPFTEHVIRSPFNPFPSAVLFLQRLTMGFGIVGLALAIWGAIAAARRRRRLALAMTLYVLPTAALLAVLENWTEPTRLWLLVCLLLPPLVFVVIGFEDLWRGLRIRRWLPAVVVASAAVVLRLALPALLAAAHEVPVDPRLRAAFPFMPAERPGEMALLRAQYLRTPWLPQLDFEAILSPLDGGTWSDVRGEITAPSLDRHPLPFAQEAVGWIFPERYRREFEAHFFQPPEPLTAATAERVRLAVDLTRVPVESGVESLRGGGAPAATAIDLVGRREPLMPPLCLAPWDSVPLQIVVAGRSISTHPVVVAFVVERPDRADPSLTTCSASDLSFELAVPRDSAVALFYVRQVLPTVMFQRGGRVGAQSIELQAEWLKV